MGLRVRRQGRPRSVLAGGGVAVECAAPRVSVTLVGFLFCLVKYFPGSLQRVHPHRRSGYISEPMRPRWGRWDRSPRVEGGQPSGEQLAQAGPSCRWAVPFSALLTEAWGVRRSEP